MIYDHFYHSSRHSYSQYLTAQVIDSYGRPIRSTESSFYHFLRCLEWVPAYRPLEGEQRERKYLCPNSVYLTSPEVTNLLGTHVFYVDIDPSEFSRSLGKNLPCGRSLLSIAVLIGYIAIAIIAAGFFMLDRQKKNSVAVFVSLLGMRQSISVDALINYLKEWCVKPEENNQEQRLPEDESEGANFTSTVKHIHNVYTYLLMNCPQKSLKELFQHTPAVFIEYNRYVVNCISTYQLNVQIESPENTNQNLSPRRNDDWCSGRFYHLKEVCWSDPTAVFQRYRPLTHEPDSPVQEPKLLAPFYSPLKDMRTFFTRVSCSFTVFLKRSHVSVLVTFNDSSCNYPTCIKYL